MRLVIRDGAHRLTIGDDRVRGTAQVDEKGKSVEVTIAGKKIVLAPNAPMSGMTLFGENGFVIGGEAFRSEAELTKTVLHELYRLQTSQVAQTAAASQAIVTSETELAASFAEKACHAIK